MLLLKENFIYQKIRDNEAPYWELYAITNYMRSASPVDVYNPEEDMAPDAKIQQSIARLHSVLDMYRDNIADTGGNVTFSIILKKNQKSHSTGRFEFNFKLDMQGGEGLSGTSQAQSPQATLPPNYLPKEVLDQQQDLFKKEVLLSVKEAQLEAKEKELKRWEQELSRKNKPYEAAMDRAVLKLVETFAGEETTQSSSGLQGVPPERQDDVRKIEQIGDFLFQNFTGNQLDVIYNFVTKYAQKLNNYAKVDKSNQAGADTSTETTDTVTD